MRPTLLALSALLLSASVSAAPPPPPHAHWLSYRGGDWCSLFRMTDGKENPIFELRDVPGADIAFVLVPLPLDRVLRVREPQVIVQPSGETLPGSSKPSYMHRNDLHWVAARINVGRRRLLTALQSASAVEVRDKEGVLAEVDLPAASAAIAALGACEDALLAKWGVDVSAYRSLASPPIPIERGQWFHNADYPVASLRTVQSGYTVARVTIDEKGDVLDCTIVGPSGSQPLDVESCKVIRTSGHYRPARNAAGEPVRSQTIEIVEYRIQ